MTQPTDVSKLADLQRLKDKAYPPSARSRC